MTTDQLQQRITDLTAERSALETAVDALQAQHGELDGRLDALLADAERSGTKAAKTAAAEGETALTALDQQLRRKRAALTACEADIAQAQADLAAAKRAGVLDELFAAHAEYERLARALDDNIGDTDAWGRLDQLAKQGNALFRQLRGEAPLGRLFLTWPDVQGPMLQSLSARIDGVCDLRRGGDAALYPSVLLDVERAGRRIASLYAG